MKTFVVLGMHRSATSLVAKGLSNVIHIGDDIMGPGEFNPWGHYENLRFVALNDKILAAAEGSWCQPPSEEKILACQKDFDYEIKSLIHQESIEHDLWGWKDPRTTLTIKLFLPYLVNPHFIACFRDPHEIALSLQKRDKFTIEFGMKLTNEYNNRLLKFLTEWTH